MTNYIYSRYNKDSQLFDPPFIAANDRHACQTFCYLYQAFADRFLDHYDLVCVGVFNNETGGVIGQDPAVIDLKTFIDDVKPSVFSGLAVDLTKHFDRVADSVFNDTFIDNHDGIFSTDDVCDLLASIKGDLCHVNEEVKDGTSQE